MRLTKLHISWDILGIDRSLLEMTETDNFFLYYFQIVFIMAKMLKLTVLGDFFF